ncbi:MAG: divalent cation tolerance protein CutA [Spirochaetota bacterium]
MPREIYPSLDFFKIGMVENTYLGNTQAGGGAVGNEVLLFLKTEKRLVDEIITELPNIHSYEVPELIALPVVNGLPEYLSWIEEELKKKNRG